MKKIVLLIDSLTQGGAQRQIAGLGCLLKHRGYDVQVLTYHDLPFYSEMLDKNGVPHAVIDGATRPLQRIYSVRQTLKRLQPDVLISFLDVPNIVACLSRVLGVKTRLIVSERNTTQRLSRTERLKFSLYRFADHIVPNSLAQARFIEQHYPKLTEKVTTISNFVDLETFAPASRQRKPTAELRVIGVGRTEKQKNIPRLIEAVGIARKQGCPVVVDWYGRKTGEIDRCLQMVRDMGMEEVFRFHEPTNDIASRYREADLFCLPSLFEGYPNVLCEAMASGLPVACSDVCDNSAIMEDGKNGYLFQPTDANALANVLMRFYHLSTDERSAMATESRSLAEQRFSKEKFIEKYIALIEC